VKKTSGFTLIVSSPSGGGKTTVVNALLREDPLITRIVTCTSRAPRLGEKDGMDYNFWNRARFEREIKNGGMLEHAVVHGNYYGVPRKPFEKAMAQGKIPVLVIDVQGARTVSKIFREAAVLAFVLPPDWKTLERRLLGRKDGTTDISLRLRTARKEIAAAKRYGYMVVNEDVDRTVGELKAIITAEKMKTVRQIKRMKNTADGYKFY
jgi:guanylate kinase